jgi:hypothetical protein
MKRFLTDLVYRDNKGESWTLVEPLVYDASPLLGRLIEVPVGFETDLASIPWFVQGLISKVGPWDRPAVIHDRLYRTQTISRLEADNILLQAMDNEGVGSVKKFLIYRNVRMWGWVAWRKNKKALSK